MVTVTLFWIGLSSCGILFLAILRICCSPTISSVRYTIRAINENHMFVVPLMIPDTIRSNTAKIHEEDVMIQKLRSFLKNPLASEPLTTDRLAVCLRILVTVHPRAISTPITNTTATASVKLKAFILAGEKYDVSLQIAIAVTTSVVRNENPIQYHLYR